MGAQSDTSTSAPEVWHSVQQILAPIFVPRLLATYLAAAIEPGQILGRLLGAVGGQAPRLLHVRLTHTHHGADLVAFGRDRGAAQGARPPARANPCGRGARLAIGCGDLDVAAKPDDVIKVELLGQQPIQLMAAEAAVGDDADPDLRRQDLRQPHQQAVLIEIAAILRYGAQSWRSERRVAARIEATPQGLDIRYVVTTLRR